LLGRIACKARGSSVNSIREALTDEKRLSPAGTMDKNPKVILTEWRKFATPAAQ
jgi:hypothetical protein